MQPRSFDFSSVWCIFSSVAYVFGVESKTLCLAQGHENLACVFLPGFRSLSSCVLGLRFVFHSVLLIKRSSSLAHVCVFHGSGAQAPAKLVYGTQYREVPYTSKSLCGLRDQAFFVSSDLLRNRPFCGNQHVPSFLMQPGQTPRARGPADAGI